MAPHSLNGVYLDSGSQVLWEDGKRAFRRGWRLDHNGIRRSVLIVLPATDQPSRSSLDRLAHEYELKDELDGAWAALPLDLVRDAGRTMLVLEDAGGQAAIADDGYVLGPIGIHRVNETGVQFENEQSAGAGHARWTLRFGCFECRHGLSFGVAVAFSQLAFVGSI